MPALFSLIIPMYNVEKYITACLESVFPQLNDEIEVILVDDGGPDKSAEIAQRLIDDNQPKTKNVRIIYQENAGLSGARNTGIKNSTGKYLCFLDSDDLLMDDFFSTVRKNIENNGKANIFAFNAVSFSEMKDNKPVVTGSIPVANTVTEHVGENHDSNEENAFLLGECNRGLWYAWARVYKRELFEYIEFPVGRNFEDFQTVPLLYMNSQNSIVNIPKPLLAYRINPQGITRSASRKELNDLDHTIEFYHKKIAQHPEWHNYMATLYVSALKSRFLVSLDILGFVQACKELNEQKRNHARISAAERKVLSFRNSLFYSSTLLYWCVHSAKKFIKN
ncbi:glycosyltransferase family 2 protein [Serratia marcescens]|uniref:glycosyltransferase family 2 protein n=1 Tax=Serratia marcescens TaxID=615 RepID=UPI0023807B45|nr:glycosyltransferase [Serratia marcescens]